MKHCCVITDNKIGNINPALGLAEAIACDYPLTIHHQVIAPPWWVKILSTYCLSKMGFMLKPLLHILYGYDIIPKKFPDLVIGNGNASVTACALLRVYAKRYGYSCVFIQLQNPRISPEFFDFVIPPSHDGLKAPNVIATIGSLTHITKKKLQSAKSPYGLCELPDPVVSVFVGGSNSRYKFDSSLATQFAKDIKAFGLHNHVSLAVTASRRTGKENTDIIKNILGDKNIYFWDGIGDNPYFAMLHRSKAAIITADSVNMISEAATAGLQVIAYPLEGKAKKFTSFYSALKRRKILEFFSLEYRPRRIVSLNETKRIAKIIISHLKQVI